MSRGRAIAVAGAAGALATACVVAFGVWAASSWRAAADRIEDATAAIAVAEARATQAELYGPLRAAWTEYAGTDISGLVRAPTGRDGLEALEERIEARFTAADAADVRVAPLSAEVAPDDAVRSQRLVLEARARVAESRLFGLLTALETETPYVFIEQLDLRAAPPPDGDAGGPRAGRWVDLQARLVGLRAAGGAQ